MSNENIKSVLNVGKAGEFWKILCREIDKDIEKLETERDDDEMARAPSDVYKLAMENIKDQIKHLKDLKNKPDKIIQSLDNLEPEEEENLDPYPQRP